MDAEATQVREGWTRRLVLGGWLGFTISGVLYLISGFQAKDELVIVGSVVWLMAVSLFLLAFFRAEAAS